jgi:hypothetical protein
MCYTLSQNVAESKRKMLCIDDVFGDLLLPASLGSWRALAMTTPEI